MAHTEQTKVWHTTIDSSGRVLLPSQLRNDIGVEIGTPMVWAKDEEGGVRLRSFNDVLNEIQNYYVSLTPAEDVWSDTLIRERRTEAVRD